MALSIVELSHSNDAPDNCLKMALLEALQLQQRELYVIRLVCDSVYLNSEQLPEKVQNIELSEEDKLLNEEAKLAKARTVLYSAECINYKEQILFHTNNALSYLINDYIEDEKANDATIKIFFAHQITFITVLLIFIVTLYILLLVLVLFPLFKNQEAIHKNAKMELKGAYEVRYIAAAYNAVC